MLRLATLVFVLPTVVLAVRRTISEEDSELDVGEELLGASTWGPVQKRQIRRTHLHYFTGTKDTKGNNQQRTTTAPKKSRAPRALLQQNDEIWPWGRRAATTTAKWKKSTTTSTTSPRAADDDGDDDEDPFYIPGIADEPHEPRARRQPSQPLNPLLPECTDLPSFKHSYSDEETEELVFHGQCDISASPGAYFSSSGDEEWSCWSEETPAELRNDAHAIEAGFVGACNFGEWYLALGPEDAETCDHVPVDCSPGGSVFWGACHTALSDDWLCIQRPDQVKHEEEQERVVEQFAGGACRALALRDDLEGNMYAGVCAFKNEQQELFKV